MNPDQSGEPQTEAPYWLYKEAWVKATPAPLWKTSLQVPLKSGQLFPTSGFLYSLRLVKPKLKP